MDNLPIKESDLLSFAGIAGIVPLMVGGLKKLWPSWIVGKEPLLCFAATYLLGVGAKLTMKAVAFNGAGWLTTLVGLFFTALAAAAVHDTFVNKILTSKGDPPKTGG